jgi:hypothetical protein
MAGSIEVRIAGRGSAQDGAARRDAAQIAHCDLCANDVDAVASVTASGPYACKSCLRIRLEAMTVGTWLLREGSEAGLPWGKVSG